MTTTTEEPTMTITDTQRCPTHPNMAACAHLHMGQVECPACDGKGETAAPGTYGPTVSPENLETRPCVWCDGHGEVATRVLDEYEAHILEVLQDRIQPTIPVTTEPPF